MRSIFLFAVCLFASWPFGFARNPAPTEGLVAYYPFDGDALDATTNHLDGFASNTVAVADRLSNPTGALGFDGNLASVNLGNPAAFNFTDSFTIACWVKLTNSQINTYIVAKYNPGASTRSYGLGTAASSQPYAFVMGDGPGYRDISGGRNLADGQWHAIVFVYDLNSGITIYSDGIVVGTATAPDLPPFTNSVPLMVGRTVSGQAFAGAIDDLRIYNRALSPDEVTLLGPTPEIKISAQPASYYLAPGEKVALSVSANAVATAQSITFQWLKNGNEVPNAVEQTLFVNGPASGTDVYQVRLTSGTLTNFSNEARITVPPTEPSRLLAHYTFEHDTQYKIVDETGVFSGILTNGAYGPGRVGSRALKFDGDITMARVPCAVSPLDLAATQYTIAWWMKAESTSRSEYIVWMGDGDSIGGYGFGFNTTGSGWYHNSGADPVFSPATRLINTNWTHIALVWNGSERVLFINGAVSNRVGTVNAIVSERDDDLFIGGRIGASVFFKGSLDDLRIYNYALASDEIQQLATANVDAEMSIAASGPNLVLTWPVIDSNNTYRVEFATSLAPGAQWTPASGLPQKSGDYYTLTQSAPPTPTFYRLRKL